MVHNFGPRKAEGGAVRLIIDGRLGPEQPVDLPVGEDQPVVFNHTFTSPGDHLIEVQLDPDPLKLDDRRRLAVPVREHLNVLLVDGHFKSEPFQAETDYLAQALNPAATSEGSPSVIRAEVVSEGQLARRELAPYDVVMLCNMAQFTEAEVNALDDYLKQGGGVVFFGGDQVVRDNYNRLLYADGKGLLPAAIGPDVGDASKKESAFGFNPLGYRHPIVEPFANEPDAVVAGLTGVKTWQFHKLTVPPGSPAKVALAFDNGDPAVVEMPRYRGTVIQVATSADAGWTNWPAHASYPPVMEQVIFQAASGRQAERNVRVGQPLDQAAPAHGGLGARHRGPARRSRAPLQTPGGRGRQPAPFRGHRAFRTLSGQGRPAARRSRCLRRTPTRPRATPPSSTAPPWPTPSPAGASPISPTGAS